MSETIISRMVESYWGFACANLGQIYQTRHTRLLYVVGNQILIGCAVWVHLIIIAFKFYKYRLIPNGRLKNTETKFGQMSLNAEAKLLFQIPTHAKYPS